MFADEQRVLLQRCRAAVGQIVPLRRRSDDDEFAAKIIAQIVGFTLQPPEVLREQAFNRRAQQARIIRLQSPVNVKISVVVHGNGPLDAGRPAQHNSASGQINFGVSQIEFQFPRGQDNAHLPDLLFGESFGFGRPDVGAVVADKISRGKIGFAVHGYGHGVGRAGLRQDDSAGGESRLGQIQIEFLRCLLEQRMPLTVNLEGFDRAQHAVGILLGGDITEAEGIGGKQGGHGRIPGVGQNHIAGAMHLQSKIIIRHYKASIGHLDKHLLVRAQFAEQHIHTDGFRSFFGQFLDEPSINFPWPVEAELKAKFLGFVGPDESILYSLDAVLADGDEREVGGGGCGKIQRGSRAQIVGHALQPLQKIQPRQPQAANERENGDRQNDRRGLEPLEFHPIGLNKKPEQLKAALVSLKITFNQNGHAGLLSS